MKIISQFRDFYDWKVAEYKMDETLIFDRRDPVLLIKESLSTRHLFDNPNDTDALHAVLYVGNALVHIFSTLNEVYTHFDLANVEDLNCHRNHFWGGEEFRLKNGKTITITSYLFTDEDNLFEQMKSPRSKNIFGVRGQTTGTGAQLQWEDFAKKPLLLIRSLWQDSFAQVEANPFLAQVGIYIDPDFVWQNVVQFLSDLKSQTEKSPEVSNDQRIANKGFDKKTSFRPKMKKK